VDSETPAANVTMYGRVGAGLGEAEGAGLGDAAALGLGEGESEGAGLASGEGEGDASGEADGLGEGEASGLGVGPGESDGAGLTSGLGVGAGESEGAGLTSGDGAAEGSGDGAGDELGAGDGLADGSAASAATGANSDTTSRMACTNASARRRRSAGRNPDMLKLPHQMRRPVAQDPSARGEALASRSRMKRRRSVRVRGTRRTRLTAGRGATAIQLSSENPVSDFRWYRRYTGRLVPRAISGAWTRHRYSTFPDSTAAEPTRPHRTPAPLRRGPGDDEMPVGPGR